MDRQAHDYAAAAAMAFSQQQQQAANIQQPQQFGFHPQHQQFPPQVHGPPFLPPHPSLQQFPFHRHMQQPQPQLHSHPPPHPHLLHQPPAFPSHLPPHLGPSPFHGPSFDSPPPAPPPSDPELQKCIDKLVEYAAKNGPEFEAMIREKQHDNPAYSFLFGGDGHNYYRYKLWISTCAPGGPFNPPFPLHPPNPMMNQSPLNPPLSAAGHGVSPSMLGHLFHRFMNSSTVSILSLLLAVQIMINLQGLSKDCLDRFLLMLQQRCIICSTISLVSKSRSKGPKFGSCRDLLLHLLWLRLLRIESFLWMISKDNCI